MANNEQTRAARATKSFKELSRATTSYQELPRVTKNYQELPTIQPSKYEKIRNDIKSEKNYSFSNTVG